MTTGAAAGDFVDWPPAFAERYREAGYWQGQTLGDLLRDWATSRGERTAIIAGNRRLSYAELDRRADRLCAGLHRLGIAPDDHVVVHLPNVPEFLILCFALVRLGALPVLALPAHRRHEIAHLCEFSSAVAYVIPDVYDGFDYRDLAAEVKASSPALEHVIVTGDAGDFLAFDDIDADSAPTFDRDSADIAFLLLSGGTTGLPKLIPRTHDDYVYNVRASARVAGLDCHTVYLAVLPIAHNFALGCPGVLGTLEVGGTVVLSLSGSPPDVFPVIERERVTLSALVPALALLWMAAAPTSEHDLSSLKLVQVGGAKFNPEPAARLPVALGCALQQSFGMAEGLLSQTRLSDPKELVTTTQGRPLSEADVVRVVDDSGHDVEPGELGHLLVRGPYTIRGYYRAPDYNATAFTADGYFRTGDVVRLTPTGHIVVEGRVRDIINRCGDKICSAEVENYLLAHPAIRDAAVVGIPDELMGERTCMCILPDGDAPTFRDVTKFLRDCGLAEYKLPDRVEIFDALPYTAVGKVDKASLRASVAGYG